MKTMKKIGILPMLLLITQITLAQANYHAADVHLTISGTSSMHDWDMKSAKGTSNATFTFNEGGQLAGLTALIFSTPAESLKSDKSSMDKNAYKALKTKQHSAISFILTDAQMASGSNIKCKGKLSIAGVTQDADLDAIVKVNADKSISVKGTQKISMKNFSMSPPTFMMGAVKTGNDVTLTFDLTFKK